MSRESTADTSDTADERRAAFLEGRLDDAAMAAYAERLASSAELRAELRAEARLQRRVAALPREIEPERDLFPEIAARLEARPAATRGSWSRTRLSTTWRPALAALLGIALGMAVTFASLTGSKNDDLPGAGETARIASAQPANARPADGSKTRPARFEDGDLSARIEADFLRARETLWVEAMARRDDLPPETWQAVVENLGLLDRVIRELRTALEADPGNRRLEKLLLANHQRQLDVLHLVTRQV